MLAQRGSEGRRTCGKRRYRFGREKHAERTAADARAVAAFAMRAVAENHRAIGVSDRGGCYRPGLHRISVVMQVGMGARGLREDDERAENRKRRNEEGAEAAHCHRVECH